MYFDLINGPAQQLMRDISQRAITSRADWVKQILELSSEWRPYGYRHAYELLNACYLGDQQEGLTQQLQKQFPKTWRRFPTNMVLPVLRRWID